MRDDTLVQKLYHTLNNILGETLLAADAESYLLASFSTKFQLDELGSKDKDWAVNPNEAHVSFSNNFGCSLLNKGSFVDDLPVGISAGHENTE